VISSLFHMGALRYSGGRLVWTAPGHRSAGRSRGLTRPRLVLVSTPPVMLAWEAAQLHRADPLRAASITESSPY